MLNLHLGSTEGNIRDFLSQVWKVKTSLAGREFFSGSPILGHFDPQMVFLMLILHSELKRAILETF